MTRIASAGRHRAHARGEVHDRADRRVLGAPLEADLAAGGVADGDADAEREIVAAPAPLLRQVGGALPHRDREPHRVPRRVVERNGIVEEHQHAVAGELGDGAAVLEDHRPDRVVELAQHGHHLFGLGGLGERGEAAHVAEQHRDLAAVAGEDRVAAGGDRLGELRA